MKKLLLFVCAIFFASCSNFNFNKGYYFSSSKTANAATGSEEFDDPVDPSGEAETEIAANTDPFKIPPYDVITANGWDGSKIDDWYFHVSFDDATVPTYQFKPNCSGHGHWTAGDTEKNEKKSTSPDGENKAQGYSISGMTVHRYDGKNPLYKGTSAYNVPKPGIYNRIERFRFFRIVGTAVVAPLDQHLIAVDTYSKFIFAYGKIVKTTNAAGKLLPTGFEPLDVHPCDRGSTQGFKLAFYMYDPLGFVKEDGTVVLYDEYRSEMGNATTGQTKYFPQIHDKDRGVAEQTDSKGAGCSPYLAGNGAGTNTVDLTDTLLDELSEGIFQNRPEDAIAYETKSGGTDYVKGGMETLNSWEFDAGANALSYIKYVTENGVTNASEPIIYTYKAGQYTEEKSTNDDMRRIYVNGETELVVEYVVTGSKKEIYSVENGVRAELLGEMNYADPGIHWLIRVRGATFVNGNIRYVFSPKGGKVTISGFGKRYSTNCDGDYWFTTNSRGEDVNANTVVYQEGPADYSPFRLQNDDFEIISKVKANKYGDVAYRTSPYVNESDSTLAQLFNQVAQKTFKQRFKEQWYSVGQIYGWKQVLYSFSQDGRTLTKTEIDGKDYQEKKIVTQYTYKTYSGSTLTYSSVTGDLTVELSSDKKELKSGSTVLGYFGYSDPGPHFLVRVAGWTFEDGDTVYKFSSDGTEVEMKWSGLSYVVYPMAQGVKRTWGGSLNDTVDSWYGGIPYHLQDVSGGGSGSRSGKPGTNGFIRMQQTAQGWYVGPATAWTYEAPRTRKE